MMEMNISFFGPSLLSAFTQIRLSKTLPIVLNVPL